MRWAARAAFRRLSGGHDEKEQTLNQLLSELDGFDPTIGVVLLAATNRPEVLDPALLRAGRFDRQISVDRPDKNGRKAILQVHLKKIKLAADIDPAQIAALTPGFTGADLANLVNEAAMLATRRQAQSVSLEDFTAAIERIIAGLKSAIACSIRTNARSSRITRWATRSSPWPCRAPIQSRKCRSFRAEWALWVIRCKCRPKIAI